MRPRLYTAPPYDYASLKARSDSSRSIAESKPHKIILSYLDEISGPDSMQNPPMPTEREKLAFSERLRSALNDGPDAVKGATDLARHFNLRHRGAAPVSTQTAHKWLSGRAIPTADKIETLAAWLQVTPHWLHYGPEPTTTTSAKPRKESPRREHKYPVSAETLTLAEKIRSLPPRRRLLIEELVTQFYRDSDET
jgi:transcriptional regulator with XRE-family HTH domain